jgi:hypothetical protein
MIADYLQNGKTITGGIAFLIVYGADKIFHVAIPEGRAITAAIIIVGLAHKAWKWYQARQPVALGSKGE